MTSIRWDGAAAVEIFRSGILMCEACNLHAPRSCSGCSQEVISQLEAMSSITMFVFAC